MPTWTPSSDWTKRSIGLPIIVLLIILGLWIFAISNVLSGARSGFSSLNFLFLTIFLIYLLGRIYGEIRSDKDFMTISAEGIEYRETPAFHMGWLPSKKSYHFDELKSIDMVSAKKMFNPKEETFGILLHFHKGRSKLIGTRFAQKQLMEVVLALKGSVMLTGSLKRILGEDVTLKDVVDSAKGLWNSFKQKRGEDQNY